MAFLWFTAGLWKLIDISGWQLKLTQLLVPVNLSLLGDAYVVGIAEVAAGVLLLRPAWRRLGRLAVLRASCGIHGLHGSELPDPARRGLLLLSVAGASRRPGLLLERRGNASCFPCSLCVSRVLPRDFRRAALAVAGVAAFAAIMLGVDRLAPESEVVAVGPITVDGSPYELDKGKIFLFFFNPSCMHCLDAGQTMAKYSWEVDFVGVPTQDPDWGPGFVEDAALSNVRLSPDVATLRGDICIPGRAVRGPARGRQECWIA